MSRASTTLPIAPTHNRRRMAYLPELTQCLFVLSMSESPTPTSTRAASTPTISPIANVFFANTVCCPKDPPKLPALMNSTIAMSKAAPNTFPNIPQTLPAAVSTNWSSGLGS